MTQTVWIVMWSDEGLRGDDDPVTWAAASFEAAIRSIQEMWDEGDGEINDGTNDITDQLTWWMASDATLQAESYWKDITVTAREQGVFQ